MNESDAHSKGISAKWKDLAGNERWKGIHFYCVDICDQQARLLSRFPLLDWR